ncbi:MULTISPECIES: hypothetical protein [Streptomyces]|uniref:Restriction endonuclease n=1 Tax=Streptomyces dengpaensis TaxID=2049881 RepID=A0ABN5HWP8_9ACTN|nr:MULTISPECIES: hypothetical protein [Streptomyces]AVH55586.1 hypothetical protein C4B68_07105 [Streptomyces dengpaensis]PIB11848.1 hypothetical protein B1C81_01060 [Streptomyces sp. HG99]
MTSTTPAVRTADTDVSAFLVGARRELDSIANRGIVSAPRAVADTLTTLEELAPALIPHARALAATLGEKERSELHELIERTERRSAARPRADLAYEHLLVLVSQLQELLRQLERAHGIACRRTKAGAAKRRSNQDSTRPQM